MKETLSTIAERTGCSVTTVSRVLSGKAEKHRISQETIEKVLKDAREHNYSPSLIAQRERGKHLIYFVFLTVFGDFPDLRALRFDSWMALRTFSLRAALFMPTVTLSNEPSSPLMNDVPRPCSYSILS